MQMREMLAAPRRAWMPLGTILCPTTIIYVFGSSTLLVGVQSGKTP
jgi:hypothetical protein